MLQHWRLQYGRHGQRPSSTTTILTNENANLTLNSGGGWDMTSGSKSAVANSIETTAYSGEGAMPSAIPGQPSWYYTTHAKESGSNMVDQTQMVVWTVVNGNWATTTNYSGSTSTSETYFKFTAAATDAGLGATPSSLGAYSFRVRSNRKPNR